MIYYIKTLSSAHIATEQGKKDNEWVLHQMKLKLIFLTILY